MTPEEKNMLTDLAAKIAQTPAPPRDPEAEDFIRKSIGSRPDALYIMTQTVLIQNMALHQAQQQIQSLQQDRGGQSAPVSSGQSFLGGQAPPPRPPAPPAYQQQAYSAPPPQYAPAPQYAPPPPQAQPSAGSSFLQNAAQTAAGVAAGTLAVQGIESLFHGGGHLFGGGGYGYGGGYGGPGFLGGGGAPVEENIVNNYYDNSGGGGGDYRDDRGDNYDASAQDDSSYDDNSGDDASVDDSSYDDNSGGDGGGDNFV
jgi:hypothetical protein